MTPRANKILHTNVLSVASPIGTSKTLRFRRFFKVQFWKTHRPRVTVLMKGDPIVKTPYRLIISDQNRILVDSSVKRQEFYEKVSKDLARRFDTKPENLEFSMQDPVKLWLP